jgi:ribose/xylose/arabinose/galactoside ABC-type transport system permease subunit
VLSASGPVKFLGWARAAQQRPWIAPLAALLVAYAAFAIVRPESFASAVNLATMARQTVVVGITAVGMTLVIVHGGIDLSVGSAVALGTVVIASLLRSGAAPLAACAGGIAACASAGLANGWFIARVRVPPFIVTLAAMSILRGLA